MQITMWGNPHLKVFSDVICWHRVSMKTSSASRAAAVVQSSPVPARVLSCFFILL